jgi:hypothetical protein
MSVEEKFWSCPFDVGVEGRKPQVDLILAIMHVPWRIVRDEHIHGRKFQHVPLDFRLFEKIVATGLVLPGATKTAEHYASESKYTQVQISNRRRKGGAGIVVAFDCYNLAAVTLLRGFENDGVGEVAT